MSSSLLPSLNFYFNPTPKPRNRRSKHPPIYISTKPSDLKPLDLRNLFHSANLSCHRFPNLGIDGRADPVDLNKLRIALKHSAVAVSVFCRSKFLSGEHWDDFSGFGFEELFDRTVPMSESERQLVGFGRAVSDGGLTASIHDIVVIPSLQRLGIGRKIIERIIRILTRRDIYDISALCSEKERLFFRACGFGDDSLGSTTMIYTRTVSSYTEGYPLVKQAGRMLLLVPPPRDSYQSVSTTVEIEDLENQ